MSRFLNYASSLLDGVDNQAKEALSKEQNSSAADRRRRRRLLQEQESDTGDADRSPYTPTSTAGGVDLGASSLTDTPLSGRTNDPVGRSYSPSRPRAASLGRPKSSRALAGAHLPHPGGLAKEDVSQGSDAGATKVAHFSSPSSTSSQRLDVTAALQGGSGSVGKSMDRGSGIGPVATASSRAGTTATLGSAEAGAAKTTSAPPEKPVEAQALASRATVPELVGATEESETVVTSEPATGVGTTSLGPSEVEGAGLIAPPHAGGGGALKPQAHPPELSGSSGNSGSSSSS
ncbi:unnamed protein product, partial [Discosporangium mesarthrocarpum]